MSSIRWYSVSPDLNKFSFALSFDVLLSYINPPLALSSVGPSLFGFSLLWDDVVFSRPWANLIFSQVRAKVNFSALSLFYLRLVYELMCLRFARADFTVCEPFCYNLINNLACVIMWCTCGGEARSRNSIGKVWGQKPTLKHKLFLVNLVLKCILWSFYS